MVETLKGLIWNLTSSSSKSKHDKIVIIKKWSTRILDIIIFSINFVSVTILSILYFYLFLDNCGIVICATLFPSAVFSCLSYLGYFKSIYKILAVSHHGDQKAQFSLCYLYLKELYSLRVDAHLLLVLSLIHI